jgi:hypothetical protein
MSVNRRRPHVLVLPEDDANRQLANGFLLDLATRQMQILTEAGGWTRVLDCFESDHIVEMRRYGSRFMVLLIDFDDNLNRLQKVRDVIPQDLADRVFVLGALSEPEALRQAKLGSYETIGKTMMADCRSGSQAIWDHELLYHNKEELNRLSQAVCGFLFHLSAAPASR